MIAADLIDWDNPLADHDLNRGRVAWWLVGDENPRWGGPQMFDVVPKAGDRGGFHGTLTNGPTWRGRLGCPTGLPALDFSGLKTTSAQYVDLQQLPASVYGTNARTIAVWFYCRTWTPGNDAAIYYHAQDTLGGSAQNLAINCEEGGGINYISVAYNGHRPGYIIGSNLSVNTWYHFALSLTAGGTSGGAGAYINGQAATATTLGGGSLSYNTLADPGTIGGQREPIVGAGLDGLVPDVSVWSRALTAGDVALLYQEGCQGYPNLLRRQARARYHRHAGFDPATLPQVSYQPPARPRTRVVAY